jgi:putative ABC transport system permease protein
VAMLNRTAAREAFGSVDPLGRLIEFEGAVREVVGLVGDVRHHTLAEESAPEIHIPLRQAPPSSAWVVAVHGGSAVSAADLRAAVRRVDPTIAVVGMASYEERLASALQGERFRAALATALGLLAVAIALLGIYGTLSNVVSRRGREIGIRLALGEGRIRLVRRVLARAATLSALGVLVGSVTAVALSSRLSGLLFEVETRDAPTYAVVALLVWGVGVLAGLGPAWTASRLDPVEAIRVE